MGLDMYLYATLYGSEYTNPEIAAVLAKVATDAGMPVEDDLPSYELQTKAAYWRKANAIHAWFVANCQDGKDECQRSHVSLDQLSELRATCTRLLVRRSKKEAEEMLPPLSGFFFGSTDIDCYFWDTLSDTVRQLDRILNNPNAGKFEYYYQSSW